MKLIDPNKLDGCKLCTTDQFPRDRRVEGWNDCIEYLQKCCVHVPVVEVVQCKDCKLSAIDAYSNRRMCIRNGEIRPNGRIWFGTAVNDDHFCAYGAKMDAEVEGC